MNLEIKPYFRDVKFELDKITVTHCAETLHYIRMYKIYTQIYPYFLYYICIYIYYMVLSVNLSFTLYAFVRQSERFSKKD